MWAPSSLEELKTQVIKAKSYLSKPKDVENYVASFEKYFTQFRYAANSEKVIEYFLQIFISTLHLATNEKIFQCFKKLILWLNHDPNSKGAYFLIKNAVEICQREFPQSKFSSADRETNGKSKQDDKQMKKRDKSKERTSSKQRERSQEGDRRQIPGQVSSETLRANLKSILSLVRKGGDKNMLIEDVYKTFVEYYLERLCKQVDQQMKEESFKPAKLGSHILSELSNILSNRNKQHVGSVTRSHIHQATGNNLSSYISLYILLQLKNIPSLLGPVLISHSQMGKNLEESKIQYPRIVVQAMSNYLDAGVDDAQINRVVAVILNKLVELLMHCINSGNFNLIPQLYKLYPVTGKQELTNMEQLVDRFYIHGFLHRLEPNKQVQPPSEIDKWRQAFVENHREYLQSTSINSTNANVLSIKYVLKLYILAQHWSGLKITRTTVKQNVDELVEIVRKETGNRVGLREIEQWIGQVQKLALDCGDALGWPEEREMQGDRIWKIEKHCQKVEVYKEMVRKLIECDREKRGQWDSIIRELQKEIRERSATENLLQNWQVILQCVFQVCRSSPQHISVVDSEHYNNQSLIALEQMSLRPPPLKISGTPSYSLRVDNISCIDILELIGCEVEKEEVINYMKKLMSETFERVDQQIIRDVIVKDLFLCKCLLLTNHTPKIKFMMDMLFAYYELSPPTTKNDKENIHKYLPKLFPTLPPQIAVDYCRFISNRDKLLMRMVLFDKQCTHYASVLESSPYDMAMNSKHKARMED